MAISFRYFVIDDDAPLRSIPNRVNEGLHLGIDAIPEFAGSRRRIIEVVLENERGKPVRILDARGRYWFFDDEGNLDRSDTFSFMRWIDYFPEEPKGKVVDLRPGIERKRWKERHFWDVTAVDLDRVAIAIWPFAFDDEPEAPIKAVKGKAQKVPPLTAAGVSLSTVRDYEKGRRTPIPTTLAAMKAALEAQGIGFVSDGETLGLTCSKK